MEKELEDKNVLSLDVWNKAPEGHVRWKLDLLAEKSMLILDVPVSRSNIGRILKKRNTNTS